VYDVSKEILEADTFTRAREALAVWLHESRVWCLVCAVVLSHRPSVRTQSLIRFRSVVIQSHHQTLSEFSTRSKVGYIVTITSTHCICNTLTLCRQLLGIW
jgi:hypothetical protein